MTSEGNSRSSKLALSDLVHITSQFLLLTYNDGHILYSQQDMHSWSKNTNFSDPSIFHVSVDHVTVMPFQLRKLEYQIYQTVKKYDDMSSHFDPTPMHAADRQIEML